MTCLCRKGDGDDCDGMFSLEDLNFNVKKVRVVEEKISYLLFGTRM